MFNIIGTTVYYYQDKYYIFNDDSKISSNLKNNLKRIVNNISDNEDIPNFIKVGKIQHISGYITLEFFATSAKAEELYKEKKLYFKEVYLILHLDTNKHISFCKDSVFNKIESINNTKYIKFIGNNLTNINFIEEKYNNIPYCYIEKCDIFPWYILIKANIDMPFNTAYIISDFNNIFNTYNITKIFNVKNYIDNENFIYAFIKDNLKQHFIKTAKIQDIILDSI